MLTARSAPLRVLQVTARYYPYMGGAETHVYEVSRRLVGAGHDVTVLTTYPGGRWPADEQVDGVKVRRVRAWPARRDYYFAPTMYHVIARGGWDIVHCQCYHTLVPPLAMLAAWRARIPYVVSFHSGGNSSPFRNAVRTLQLALLRPLLTRAERLIAVSRFEARFFRERLRVPEDRVVVIPNGSSLPTLADPPPAHPGETWILSVGRLERYKGHHRVIAALPRVLEQRPDVRLRIVGSGPYESALLRQAQALGVADYVTIGGVPAADRQQMAAVLASAALVTLLSEYEAHPIAVMEALALGRPVLVADTSGLSELAERGLVRAIPLGSTTDQVAAALLEQLRQPQPPARVELPTWERCAAELLALYQTCTRDRSGYPETASYGGV
jgi:glycosyltransferase involved in cell wall biosynthesis